jgi:Domain of unknown function (DUF4224)
MSLYLTREELTELTGYKQLSRIKLALAQLGVRFRSRPADGFPLVDRQADNSATRRREPDYDAGRKHG